MVDVCKGILYFLSRTFDWLMGFEWFMDVSECYGFDVMVGLDV